MKKLKYFDGMDKITNTDISNIEYIWLKLISEWNKYIFNTFIINTNDGVNELGRELHVRIKDDCIIQCPFEFLTFLSKTLTILIYTKVSKGADAFRNMIDEIKAILKNAQTAKTSMNLDTSKPPIINFLAWLTPQCGVSRYWTTACNEIVPSISKDTLVLLSPAERKKEDEKSYIEKLYSQISKPNSRIGIENDYIDGKQKLQQKTEIEHLESELRSGGAKMTGGVPPTGAQAQAQAPKLMSIGDLKFTDEKKRIVTFSVLRCHGQIVSPLSIYFNNKALKVLKPLFENVRDFVPGGLPGQSVVSEGFCGIRSRMGGVQFAQKLSIEIAKQEGNQVSTNKTFDLFHDAAKPNGDLNRNINQDFLIDNGIDPNDSEFGYRQGGRILSLFSFSENPEKAKNNLLNIREYVTGNRNYDPGKYLGLDDDVTYNYDQEIKDIIKQDKENNTKRPNIDYDLKGDSFSSCAIISVTDYTQDTPFTLTYNNVDDKNDVFDINDLGNYDKIKHFIIPLVGKDAVSEKDPNMRKFTLRLQIWVQYFILEWNNLIRFYLRDMKYDDIQNIYGGDIQFLKKWEKLNVLIDKKNTILQSNTFVQNILIMGFTKWLVNVYKYFAVGSDKNIDFIDEFHLVFDFPQHDYVQFCTNINNLLEKPPKVVKNLGNYCQVLDSNVYPKDTDSDLLKNYIKNQMMIIKRIWKQTGTQTEAIWKKTYDYEPKKASSDTSSSSSSSSSDTSSSSSNSNSNSNIGSSAYSHKLTDPRENVSLEGMGMDESNGKDGFILSGIGYNKSDMRSNSMDPYKNDISEDVSNMTYPNGGKTKHKQKQEKNNHKYTIKRRAGNKRN
jgi:hypothetical protein